jgi:hypothetical protein
MNHRDQDFNVKFSSTTMAGRTGVVAHALRDIEFGEELTTNYGHDYFADKNFQDDDDDDDDFNLPRRKMDFKITRGASKKSTNKKRKRDESGAQVILSTGVRKQNRRRSKHYEDFSAFGSV